MPQGFSNEFSNKWMKFSEVCSKNSQEVIECIAKEFYEFDEIAKEILKQTALGVSKDFL